jgi:DNA-binding NtrC family response regulator
MANPFRALVLSPNLENRQHVSSILSQQDVDHFCAATVAQCRELLQSTDVELVFCERQLSDGDFRDVLAATVCKRAKGRAKVVMLSDLWKREEYDQARRCGVFAFVQKPCHPTDIEWMTILAKRQERIHSKQVSGAVSAMPNPWTRVAS